MAFPAFPVNGQVHTENQTRYIYELATNSWLVDPNPNQDKDCHNTQRIVNIPDPRITTAGLGDLVPRDYADTVRPWITGTAYTPGHLLEDADTIYLALTTHTSTTIGADVAAGAIKLVGSSGSYQQITADTTAATLSEKYSVVGDGLTLTLPDAAAPGEFYDALSNGINNQVTTDGTGWVDNALQPIDDTGLELGALGDVIDDVADYPINLANDAAVVNDATHGPVYRIPLTATINSVIVSGYNGVAGNAIRSVTCSVKFDKTTNPGNQRVLLTWGSGGTNRRYRIQANPNATTIGVDISGSAKTKNYTFADGVWYDIAFVQTGTSLDTTTVYVNGVSLGLLGNGVLDTNVGNNVHIGCDPSNLNRNFQLGGDIANIRIFNRALAVGEVAALSNQHVALNDFEHVRMIRQATGWSAHYYGAEAPEVVIPPGIAEYDDTVQANAAYGATYQDALDFMKGQGYGATTLIQATDINLLRIGGHYYCNNTQLPTGWTFAIIHHTPYSNASHHFQIAKNIANANRMAFRNYTAGTWSAWKTVTTSDELIAANIVFTATGNTTSTNVQDAIVELQNDIDALAGLSGVFIGAEDTLAALPPTRPDGTTPVQSGDFAILRMQDGANDPGYYVWDGLTWQFVAPLLDATDFEPYIDYSIVQTNKAWDVAVDGRHGIIDASVNPVTVTLPQAPLNGDPELQFEIVDSTNTVTIDSGAVNYDVRGSLPLGLIPDLICHYPLSDNSFADTLGGGPALTEIDGTVNIVFDTDLGRNVVEFPDHITRLRAINFHPTDVETGDPLEQERTVMFRAKMDWTSMAPRGQWGLLYSWGVVSSNKLFCMRTRNDTAAGTSNYRNVRVFATNSSFQQYGDNTLGWPDGGWVNVVLRTTGTVSAGQIWDGLLGDPLVNRSGERTAQDFNPNSLSTDSDGLDRGLTLNGLPDRNNSGCIGLRLADFTIVKRFVTDDELQEWANPVTDYSQLIIDGSSNPDHLRGHVRLNFYDSAWHFSLSGTGPANHTHSIGQVNGLQANLDDLEANKLNRFGDIMDTGAYLRQGFINQGGATTVATAALSGVNQVTAAANQVFAPNSLFRFASHTTQYVTISNQTTALLFYPPLTEDVAVGEAINEITPDVNLLTDQDRFVTANELHQLAFKAWPDIFPVAQTALTNGSNVGDTDVTLDNAVTVGQQLLFGLSVHAHEVIADNGANNYDVNPPVIESQNAATPVIVYDSTVFDLDTVGQNMEVTRGHVEQMVGGKGFLAVDDYLKTPADQPLGDYDTHLTPGLYRGDGSAATNHPGNDGISGNWGFGALRVSNYGRFIYQEVYDGAGENGAFRRRHTDGTFNPWVAIAGDDNDSNFANTDLTFTETRIHQLDGNPITIYSNNTLESGSYFKMNTSSVWFKGGGHANNVRVILNTDLNFDFSGTSDLKLDADAGLPGQVITSSGPDAAPTWTTIAGVDTNFANANLTLTADRSHNIGTSQLDFTGLSGSRVQQLINGAGVGDFGESRVTEDTAFITAKRGTDQGTVTATPESVDLTFGGAADLKINTDPGLDGQALTSGGPDASPVWAGPFLPFADYLTGGNFNGNWNNLETPGVYRGNNSTGVPTGFNSATNGIIYVASSIVHQLVLDGSGTKMAFRRFTIGAGGTEPWTIVPFNAAGLTYADNTINDSDYGDNVQDALDQIKILGFGNKDQRNITDANAIRVTGNYQSTDATNNPVNMSTATILHLTYNPNHHNQLGFGTGSANIGIYWRKYVSGTWTTWIDLTESLNFANSDLTATGNRAHTFDGNSLAINATNGGFLTFDSQTAGGAQARLSLEGGELELALTGGADLKINGDAGTAGQSIVSGGPGAQPTWGAAAGSTAFIQYYAVNGAANNVGNEFGIFQAAYNNFEIDPSNKIQKATNTTIRIQSPGVYCIDVEAAFGVTSYLGIAVDGTEVLRRNNDGDFGCKWYVQNTGTNQLISIISDKSLQGSHSKLRVTIYQVGDV